MSAVGYGQAGYVGTSMSVRARAAYEPGEMPMSKWTRKAIISAIKEYCDEFDLAYDSDIESMTRAQLADTYLEYKSWHHSGRFTRGTEFFGLGEDAIWADFPEMDPERVTEREEIGLDGLLEAKSAEAELSEEIGLVRESGCR